MHERFNQNRQARIVQTIVLVGAAIFCLGLLAGCAGRSGQTVRDQSSIDPVGKFLGFDGVANKRSSELARGKRIQLCMKRLGFVYVPFSTAVAIKMADGGYAANLRQNGYGIADAMELALPEDPNDQLVKALSTNDRAAYSIALDGKETDGVRAVGCQLMAEGGTEADLLQARIGKSASTFEAAMNADREIRKIDAAWSWCMRSNGYVSLVHPSDVVAKVVFPFRKRLDADTTLTKSERINGVRTQELAVARVDAQCMPDPIRATRTKLANTYRSALLNANKPDFERLRSFYH